MILLIFIFFVLLIICIIDIVIWKLKSNRWVCQLLHRYRHLPCGPTGIPFFGSLFRLRSHGPPHQTLSVWAKQYGPCFRIRIGNREAVVVSDPGLFDQIFVKGAIFSSGRPQLPSVSLLSRDGRDLVFGDFNARWRHVRKVAHAALFNAGKLRNFEKELQRQAADLCHEMKEERINIQPLMQWTATNAISRTLAGKDFAFNDPQLKVLTNAVLDTFKALGSANLFDYLPERVVRMLSWSSAISGPAQLMKHSQSVFDKWIGEVLSEHRQSFDPEHPRDFIDLLLQSRGSKEPLDDESMLLVVKDFFLAGADTSALTLSWALYFLAQNAELQAELRADLCAQFGQHRPPSIEEALRIPLLSAVLAETWRLVTVVPITRRRSTTAGLVQLGAESFFVPADTLLLINSWHMHHNEAIHPDPFTFNPKRWKGASDLDEALKRFHVLPFGLGKRQCTGKTFALQEAHLFLAHLVLKFKFSLPEGFENLRPVYGHTLAPAYFELYCQRNFQK